MDKYIASFLQALILAAILGASGLLFTQNETMHSMDKNLALVQQQVKDLTDQQVNYLTKSEADQRGKIRDAQMEIFRHDLNELQNEFSSTFKKIGK